jgi:hypothetical protein
MSQSSNCSKVSWRGPAAFYWSSPPDWADGANILDMSTIAVDLALRTRNVTLLRETYDRVHNQMVINSKVANDVKGDGIKPDGSFGQHRGLSYAGNYAKDYVNDILALEEIAIGTAFSASTAQRDVFATLIDGDRWAVIRNSVTGVLHWDLSVLSRFISFPVADLQATSGLKLNLTQIESVGQAWANTSGDALSRFASTVVEGAPDANAGSLVGNRMFFSNDYM